MFQGTSLVALDAKGRLNMPVRYRQAMDLCCQGQVTLTRHPDGCLLIYPDPTWLKLKEKLTNLPFSARWLQRVVLGSAVSVALDASGRLLIPNDLRQLVGLQRDVMLIGLGEHFELWDKASYIEFEARELSEQPSGVVDDFMF